MKEFKGKAGVIYVEQRPKQSEDDKPYEVWFEDFCIIGTGDSETEALQNAERMTVGLAELVRSAMTDANPLTEEESQLIIGAIPLQAL